MGELLVLSIVFVLSGCILPLVSPVHLTVSNYVGESIDVACASANDRIANQHLAGDGGAFGWDFKDSGYVITYFWCDVYWGSVHVKFDAYNADRDGDLNAISWFLTQDGIYKTQVQCNNCGWEYQTRLMGWPQIPQANMDCGGFYDTCDWVMFQGDTSVLTATCKNIAQERVKASIDLNSYLGTYSGHLVLGDNFMASCDNPLMNTEQSVLVLCNSGFQGLTVVTKFNLKNRVNNRDGHLEWCSLP